MAASSPAENRPLLGGPNPLPRSESLGSNVSYGNRSDIVIGAEQLRQRYVQWLLPQQDEAGPDGKIVRVFKDDKDYVTRIHSIPPEKLEALFKTKFLDNPRCNGEGGFGLYEEQARNLLEAVGSNVLTPSPKANIWLRLLKHCFLGIFNLLLWFCVVCQVALILLFAGKSAPQVAEIGTLINASAAGSVDMAIEEVKGEEEGDYVTPIILTLVILFAGVLRWWTELKAESQMEAMEKMGEASTVKLVRRDKGGKRIALDINGENLVPGDIIFLDAGDKVPADVRIIYCSDGMEVDNSALTGESVPVPRKPITEAKGSAPIEACNLAFFGSSVLKGSATCIVTFTGDHTYLGKINAGIKDAAGKNKVVSTLEQQIDDFIHKIAGIALLVGGLNILANRFSSVKRSPSDILQNSAGALFAQVPEGLLPTVTISLMLACSEMTKLNVIVRKIDAVETLGCITVFCSDKTGTLTTGEMTVQDLVVPMTDKGDPANGLKVIRRMANMSFGDEDVATKQVQDLARAGVLNNASILKGAAEFNEQGGKEIGGSRLWTTTFEAQGSPTEVAIFRVGIQCIGGPHNMMKIRNQEQEIWQIPFNSENKWMVTAHQSAQDPDNYIFYLKGGPDKVLPFTTSAKNAAAKMKIEQACKELMDQGRRVLCLATRTVKKSEVTKTEDGNVLKGSNCTDCNFPFEDFRFVGLVGIEDPPKAGVADAVVEAQEAGVKVVMVTGDHKDTARAIAKRINIIEDNNTAKYAVIEGTQLNGKMPVNGTNFGPQEPANVSDFWKQAVKEAVVFARVSPIHKQVIVQAFQHYGADGTGDICAMTGDGVNDAPALKQAEVGVAMGIRGTAVAKDAADIVLADDNFASIVRGIEQGRVSSMNLQKSIMYTLCSKMPQAAPTFAELFGVPQALSVAQVLLIDIGTDIWTAILFAYQKAESKLMRVKPRHPKIEKMVNAGVLLYSYAWMGFLQMVFCFLMFFYASPGIMDLMTSGKDPNQYTRADEHADRQGMTVYYWTLVMGQIGAAISTTTTTQSLFFGASPYGFPNRMLSLMFVAEVLGGIVAIYSATMQSWFQTAALPMRSIYLPAVACVGIVVVEEARKAVRRALSPEE